MTVAQELAEIVLPTGPAKAWEIPVMVMRAAFLSIRIERGVEEELEAWAGLLLQTIEGIEQESASGASLDTLADWSGIDPAALSVPCRELHERQILVVSDDRVTAHPTLTLVGERVLRQVQEEREVVALGQDPWPVDDPGVVSRLHRIRPLSGVPSGSGVPAGPCPPGWKACLSGQDILGVEVVADGLKGSYMANARPLSNAEVLVEIQDRQVGGGRRSIGIRLLASHPCASGLRVGADEARIAAVERLGAMELSAEAGDDGAVRIQVSGEVWDGLSRDVRVAAAPGLTHEDRDGAREYLFPLWIEPADTDAATAVLIDRVVVALESEPDIDWKRVRSVWEEGRVSLTWGVQPRPDLDRDELLARAWKDGAWAFCYRLSAERDGLA